MTQRHPQCIIVDQGVNIVHVCSEIPTEEARRHALRQIGQLGYPVTRGPLYTPPDPLQLARAFGEMLGELYPETAYDAADLVAKGVQQGLKRVSA